MSKPVRVRFAPSPTGFLHIGGVRTALFAYLFARANDGRFVLRLEDTDRERFVENGVEQIIESLDWLGLQPDEGVWYEAESGDYGPYIQSQRLSHYKKYAQELLKNGMAYYSHVTPEAFASEREAAIIAKRPFVYKQSMEPVNTISNTDNLPIRLKIPSGVTDWYDEVRGASSTPHDLLDDFIIIKADGYPTYNFANVIDDHLMEISHVIRGDEFISTTAKHALLYDMLGFERPKWAHLPSILGPDGKKKLSKRDGDVDVLEYRAKGYIPQALINFLALLGWNDGSTQEIYTFDELVAEFTLDRVQKSPARFDGDRLDWFNSEYIRAMSTQDLLDQLKPFLPKQWYDNTELLYGALALEQERIKTLSEARSALQIFIEKPQIDKGLLGQKADLATIKLWLAATHDTLQNVAFDKQTLEDALKTLLETLSLKPPELFFTLRIALTGRAQAPGISDILSVLGKNESLTRLKDSIDSI